MLYKNHNKIKGRNVLILTLLILIIFSLNGCNSMEISEDTTKKDASDNIEPRNIDIAKAEDINDVGIMENTSIYTEDDPSSIVYFYVTVQKGAKESKKEHTLSEVENVVKFRDGEPVYGEEVLADAIVQIGDEKGPNGTLFGPGVTTPNATISKRGNSSSQAAQSSFKLELDKNAGLWRGQRNIALNKHAFDSTRIRNKLYFDLLKDIPDVPSLRTQFVRLYIKDETSDSKQFKDYGIFTQVEVPNKKYLVNHGLDSSGYLYKVRSFNFEQNDVIKNFDDPEFNLEEFEKIMSVKGKENNAKLIEMIEAVNDINLDIDEVIDKYFDRDNYVNWLAYNILLGNIDTTMQNFYLYSPLNGNRWFFIPWDGDGSLTLTEDMLQGEANRNETWEKGIANYWSVSFHRRFLKKEKNREELKAIVLEQKGILSNEKVTDLINTYTKAIDKYVISMPDLLHLGQTAEDRKQIIEKLPQEIDINYNNFLNTLDELMPFFLETPIISEDGVKLQWEDAYDFKNQEISYKLIISASPDMKNKIHEIDNIRGLTITIPPLSQGTYYWSVIATSEDGRESMPYASVSGDNKYYGVEELVIP